MTLPLMLAACIALLAVLAMALADTAVAAPPAGTPAKPPRSLEVTVVGEETVAPIAGATVKYHDGKDWKEGTTDAAGRFNVPLPEKLSGWYSITATGPQRPRVAMSWSAPDITGNTEPPVPATCTIKLPRGTTIGGNVRDESGNPIANAKLGIRYLMISGHVGPSIGEQTVTTDDSGRWSFDRAPAEFKFAGASIFDGTLEHPDFMRKDRFPFSEGDVPRLRDGTFTLTMTKGLALTGAVTDEHGQPIKGAEVLRGNWELAGKTETDADGMFTLNNCPPGQACITVKAPGRAPQKFELDLKPDTAPLRVALAPGKMLRIKIVDNEDKPIEGASMICRNWGRTPVSFSRTTTPDGLVEWNEAPDDAVEIEIWKGDYARGSRVSLAPQAEPHVAKMTGTVRDAKSRQPIKAFTVIPIFDWRSDETGYFTSRQEAVNGNDGHYEIKMDRSDVGYHVRVEANGYRSVLSARRLHIADGDATIDFDLDLAAAITGRVIDTNGRPVQGATAYLATWTQSFQDRSGFKKPEVMGGGKATTDEHGRFTFPAQFERYSILIAHDSGSGRVDREPNAPSDLGDIRLDAWAKVEGQLFARGKPVSGTYVYLNPVGNLYGKGQPSIFVNQMATTDQEGRFAFERVAPEKVSIRADVSPWQSSALTSGETLPLDVKPGESVKITLGGPGRVVVGTVQPVGPSAATLNMRYALNYLVRHEGAIDPPPQLPDPRWKKIVGWDDSFTYTPEGNAAHRCRHSYFLKLSGDGTFRAEGLPAGKYDLRIQLYDDPKGGCLTKPIGWRTITLDVDGPDGAEKDMGTIEVEVGKIPQVGDIAPDLSFTDAQGKTKSLSEMSGKFIVIDFWATWCGPCNAEMPAVRKLHDEYAKRGVVVLGMSLDSDGDALWRAVKSRGMTWLQGWAGDFNHATAAKAYGIAAVPTMVLIAPDGKILARENSAGAIRKALENALAAKP